MKFFILFLLTPLKILSQIMILNKDYAFEFNPQDQIQWKFKNHLSLAQALSVKSFNCEDNSNVLKFDIFEF